MATEIIYGIECFIEDSPDNLEVGNNKFTRTEIPISFKSLEYDKEGNPQYSDDQIEFINQEIERCINGYHFMSNDVPTWITGHHYRYLNYWVLENGERPEYRDAGRRHFIFFQTCYNHPKIIGELRGKKRREGATSEGTCISVGIATFNKNKNCGTLSMNDTYSEKVFQSMIRYGFFNTPEFLRPRLDRSGTNKKELLFVETPERGKNKFTTIEGLNSKIDFQPLTLNSYDSTRLSFLLGDEWGKLEKIDVNRLYEVLKECVRQGARKVGFILSPTTINPPDKGGNNFKILWDNSNQFEYGLDTPTGMVQYFQPAEEGMDGFIDEFGMSVIDKPDEKTLEFLVKKQLQIPDPKERIPTEDLIKGAKKYLEDEYSKLKTEEQRSDFRRKFPRQVSDMFDFGTTYSPFHLGNINERLDQLRVSSVPLRRGKFVLLKKRGVGIDGDEFLDFNVEFEDNPHGSWLIYEFPKKQNHFEIDWDKKICRPLNTLEYGGGADTFKFDKTENLGSKGCIWIGSKMDISKPDDSEGGIPMAYYLDRPDLTDFFWDEILLASLFYGCTVTVEKDASQEFKKYFSNRMPNLLGLNCLPLLGRRPDLAIDTDRPITSKNINDTSSGDPFVFGKQIELGQIYFYRYCHKIHFPQLLEEAKLFNPDKRTKYDTVIGFLMMLLNICGQTKARAKEYKNESNSEKMVPVFEINKKNTQETTLKY